jgi:AcrR family transcriptional regulator
MKKPSKEKKPISFPEAHFSIDNPLFAQFSGKSPRKGDIARTKILAATLHCIANVGIAHTSFESVGKFAGMGRAHVAYYFPDFDQLILSAVQFAITTAQQTTVSHVFQAPSDAERLKAFIRGSFEWAEKHPEQVKVILLFYYYSSWESNYRTLHTQVRQVGAERIAAILKPLLPKVSQKRIADYAKTLQLWITGALVEALTTHAKVPLAAQCDKMTSEVYQYLGLKNP